MSCEGRCRELFRRALRGEEDVFVYSTHPDSHAIILSHYGQWDDVLVRSSAIGSREVSRPSFGSLGCYTIRPPLLDFRWGLWHLRLDLGVPSRFVFGANAFNIL